MLRSMLSFKKEGEEKTETRASSAAQAVSWEAHAAGMPFPAAARQASSLKSAGGSGAAAGAPLVPTRSRARFADGPTTESPTHTGEARGEAFSATMSKTSTLSTEDGKTPLSREALQAAKQAIKRSAPSLLTDQNDTNVMAQFIDILKETFENTEQMQEDRIKLLQQHEEENERLIAEHEEEKNRLREEMEDELERERAVLVAYNEREKEELLKELDTFREDTAKMKAEMESQMVETKGECERIAQEKEEMTVNMEKFRQDMEQVIAMEKEQARRECDTLQQDKVALQDEKLKMEAEMAQSIEQRRIETQKAAKEKEQMVNDIGNFRKECETRMDEQRKSMEEDMQRERRQNEERIAAEKKKMTLEMENMRSECQKYEQEKEQMMNDLEVFRADTDRKMAEERSELEARMNQERKQLQARIEQEKQEMDRKMRETRTECERLESEKLQLHQAISDFRLQTERKMAEEKAEMERKMTQERREFEQRMTEEKRKMQATMDESQRECDRMAEEKEQMVRDIDKFRSACESEMASMRANKEAEMEEARREMNEKLAKEQQITAAIFHAIRELPPLQTAMELGDIFKLQEELDKWSTEDRLPERFGECKGVVEAVIKLARERLIIWRNVEHTLMDVLREVGPAGSGTTKGAQALFEACHRLFRAVKEAQLTKMNLHRSHKKEMEQVCQVFMEWQAQAMQNSNTVQRAIIKKVCMCPQLGSFDFVDMDVCLRLVDRAEEGAEVFLSRALMIVEDPKNQPKDLKPLLSHVETMLFFLKYVKSEDLRLTYQEFRKQSLPLSPVVSSYLDMAAQAYPPGAELAQFSSNRGLMDRKDVSDVLEEVRSPPAGRPRDQLGAFREIFYHWAVAMQSKFDLLVLPHHTQVVCLLMIHFFMQQAQQGGGGVQSAAHALIAQVGTGEGKSMIVASLAIYVAVVLRKQVHVVVDDETLLERDFFTFKDLFDNFKTRGADGGLRPLTAALCVSEEKMAARQESCVVPRVDPDVDICYCEAKHVQSFYASIARGEKGKQDFDSYANRVLILDEVDALVIDEEPNEVFVYENKTLGQLASAVARAMADGRSLEELKNDSNPAAARVVREMQQEWDRGQKLVQGEEYVYSKETAKYCLVQGGRANPKAWSLALECKNFQDGLSRDILFKERLFVMSRPRVFRKYHRIIGLSGSIGSEAERAFLKETYRAEFFEVPPFLKCCRGSPFHEPVPAPLGEKKQAVYIEATVEAQIQRLCEVALEARERVPVLVIAKDRPQADQIVERLRVAARSRGLGGASLDIIRSLSRTLYEQDPERWKENLNRATMPIGEKSGGSKTFRCTVTDPRGGRGTDYRVDDNIVDERGGLLLIPTMVPTSQRDWVQFLGRTARQDRKGQFCAVLNSGDYTDLSTRFKQSLPPGLDAIKTVLRWADMDIADRIKKSAALYNCGVRMNEICEIVFGKKPEILTDASSRELMVEACQRLRYMSIREIDDLLNRIPSLQPSTIRTEARDLGRPAEPPQPVSVPVSRSVSTAGGAAANGTGQAVPKIVIFALDWSASMMSNDTGNGKSRWTTCLDCVKRIIKDQVHDTDYLGVIGFGPSVETVIPVSKKATAAKVLQQKLSALQPKMAGGTAFFDAISDGLGQLTMKGTAPASVPKWLICLTDGDDIGSKRENVNGELVVRLLKAGVPPSLNMVMITVGSLKEKNVKIIDSWIEMVGTRGGFAQHMRDTNAAQITESFEAVAEVLVAADVGGATEC